jgi:hypothetical protein
MAVGTMSKLSFSAPGGLASVLRTGTPAAASISLPLDVGTATDTIPPHLRRAIIRDHAAPRGNKSAREAADVLRGAAVVYYGVDDETRAKLTTWWSGA